MSKANAYTRKIAVTLEAEATVHELFAYLRAKWHGVEISDP